MSWTTWSRACLVFTFFCYQTAMARGGNTTDFVEVELEVARPIYCLKSTNVLTMVTRLSAGTTVAVPKNSLPQLLNLESGERDTSGFYSGVEVEGQTIPPRCESANGLYITALVPIHDTTGTVAPLPLVQTPKDVFKTVYQNDGRVRASDSVITWALNRNKKRFKSIWNKTFAPGELSSEELAKSQGILQELAGFANRTVETPAGLLYLSTDTREQTRQLAESFSRQTMSQYGFSPAYGAWDIAILGTATRLGFAHAPCAEFMSEVMRQAYARAGYTHSEDFHETLEERLIFTPWQEGLFGPQSVRGLSDRLMRAGWIAWDPTVYKPITGAIAMALDAWTPGHTYVVAGLNGQFIVDNGNPRGLDLRLSELKLSRFRDMYGMGVFFLPPGITPQKW